MCSVGVSSSIYFFFSSRRRHTRCLSDWSSDVCSSDLGADGRAQVVTAMQDIGTGTRTAMAQIAAEELGIPVEHVQVSLGDSARGPYAARSEERRVGKGCGGR